MVFSLLYYENLIKPKSLLLLGLCPITGSIPAAPRIWAMMHYMVLKVLYKLTVGAVRATLGSFATQKMNLHQG